MLLNLKYKLIKMKLLNIKYICFIFSNFIFIVNYITTMLQKYYIINISTFFATKC